MLLLLRNVSDTVAMATFRALTQNHLVRNRIAHNGGGETHTRRTTTGSVDSTRCDLGNVFEELRFGHTRVTHETDVDVATNLHAVANRFGDTSNEE